MENIKKMRIANNPKQLEKYINDALSDFLETDFKDYVADVTSKMVDKHV